MNVLYVTEVVDINIAYKKPAYQSSDYVDDSGHVPYPAALAVNGLLYGDVNHEFTHTKDGASGRSWWVVDLQQEFDVKELYLFNRYNSNSEYE